MRVSHPADDETNYKTAHLHHLRVSNVVRRDKDNCKGRAHVILALHGGVKIWKRTFGLPRLVHLLENLHCVWTAATNFAVPQQQAFGLNVPMDETANSGPERLLLVRACGTTGVVSM